MATPAKKMEKIHFTVDAALIRELGERLVGRAYIALAELIKNSYDADATKVEIRFTDEPVRSIEVIDNGHGMDREEFKAFWMRVGTPHKQKKRFSRGLERRMTGSKGIGRLAVQFLAKKIEIETVSDTGDGKAIQAEVDWSVVQESTELTEAYALYTEGKRTSSFPRDKPHGTRIILSGLNQSWGKRISWDWPGKSGACSHPLNS